MIRGSNRRQFLSLNRFVEPKMILAGQLGGQIEVRRFDTKAKAS
jgi:hypothetical protein